jgi:WD40 repeat protein
LNQWIKPIQADTFKFERVISAHQQPVRAIAWSQNSQMLISGDESGLIKYFTAQMTFIDTIQDAHSGPLRGLSYAPSESKFVTAGFVYCVFQASWTLISRFFLPVAMMG